MTNGKSDRATAEPSGDANRFDVVVPRKEEGKKFEPFLIESMEPSS